MQINVFVQILVHHISFRWVVLMGCSCSKVSGEVVNSEENMLENAAERETNGIANVAFTGEDHLECHAVRVYKRANGIVEH